MSKRRFGFDLLKNQVLEHVQGEMEWQVEDAIGDSEIEKLFLCALKFSVDYCDSEYTCVTLLNDENSLRISMENPELYEFSLIVFPQFQMEGRKVDFLIHVLDLSVWYPAKTSTVWRKLIVECDGHDYHERTKEQAARDKSKDRAALINGIESFRFTGSELWRDPLACARQVLDWAVRTWPR